MSGTITLSAFPIYKSLTPTQLAANKAKYAKTGLVKSEVEYFKAKVAKVTTPEAFIKDYRLLKFALTAYNMESQLQYPGRIKTILMDDPNSSKALVNRMSDASYREINAAFDFFNSGVAKLQDSTFINKLATKYAEATYEASLGSVNSSITDALYFERKIGSVTNGYQIIGDAALFAVVKTALNIPNAAVQGKVERLKAWIEKDLDMTKLKDATYVRKLVERFLILKDVETQKSSSNGLLDLFA